MRMVTQLQNSGPIRSLITCLRTKSGATKLTACSAARSQVDGQSCILAVSEDLPEYDQQKVNEGSVAVWTIAVPAIGTYCHPHYSHSVKAGAVNSEPGTILPPPLRACF